LVYFKGEKYNEYNKLEWLTYTETNSDYFILEKSINGSYWTKLTTVDGAGTTIQSTLYQYKDYNQYEGLVYYRLIQRDYDGEEKNLGQVAIFTQPKDDIKLIKVINFMGQEINPDIYNGPKLYIYENGMVVKKR
jgi:hypothetical protein